jgi:hypothetical protein
MLSYNANIDCSPYLLDIVLILSQTRTKLGIENVVFSDS